MQLLKVHVVPGKTLAAQVTDGLVAPTLGDGSLTFEVTDDSKVFVTGPNDGATAEVTTADIEAGKSVLHIVSMVLVPGEADDMAGIDDVEPVDDNGGGDAVDDEDDVVDDGGAMRDDGRVDVPAAGEVVEAPEPVRGGDEMAGGYGEVEPTGYGGTMGCAPAGFLVVDPWLGLSTSL